MIIRRLDNRIVRFLTAVVICAAAGFVLSSANVSAATTAAMKGTITSPDGVIVRASASTSANKVGEAEYKDAVTITAIRCTSASSMAAKNVWVYSSGHKGYIRSDLVSMVEKTNVSGTTTDSVNMRKGPGTGFGVIKTLANKTKVTVTVKALDKSGGAWYRVKNGKGYGFVSAAYVKLTNTASTKPATTTKPKAAAPKTVKPAAISKKQTTALVADDGTRIRKTAL